MSVLFAALSPCFPHSIRKVQKNTLSFCSYRKSSDDCQREDFSTTQLLLRLEIRQRDMDTRLVLAVKISRYAYARLMWRLGPPVSLEAGRGVKVLMTASGDELDTTGSTRYLDPNPLMALMNLILTEGEQEDC